MLGMENHTGKVFHIFMWNPLSLNFHQWDLVLLSRVIPLKIPPFPVKAICPEIKSVRLH